MWYTGPLDSIMYLAAWMHRVMHDAYIMPVGILLYPGLGEAQLSKVALQSRPWS